MIIDQFLAKATASAIPIQASIELTYRCNERCTHCYIDEFKDDPQKILSLKDWFDILHKLREAGTLYIVLMGGEPLLSPYFFDVSQKATELGFFVSTISNGLKITDQEYAKRMVQSGLKNVTFSLYSLNPSIHDKITQVKGSHQKLMHAIDLCLAEGLNVTLNNLLTKENIHDVFELYEWSVSRNLELKVDPNITPKLSGELKPTEMRASREDLLWFYRERAKRWEKSVPTPSLDTDSSYICNAAKGKCAINPYGELLPCIEIREPFGSLKEQDFQTLWMSEKALKWRTPRVKDMESLDKTNYSFCDHCPGMAKNEHQNPFKVTAFSEMVASVKRQVFEESKNGIC